MLLRGIIHLRALQSHIRGTSLSLLIELNFPSAQLGDVGKVKMKLQTAQFEETAAGCPFPHKTQHRTKAGGPDTKIRGVAHGMSASVERERLNFD